METFPTGSWKFLFIHFSNLTYWQTKGCPPAPFHMADNFYSSSFLKRPSAPNIPIQAIGLSLYESLPTANESDPVEAPGTKVTRTQWLDLSSLEMASLVGKNILIVDEVDDTRTTLEYAVRELEKDVERKRIELLADGVEVGETKFFIFVLHVSIVLLCFHLHFHFWIDGEIRG